MHVALLLLSNVEFARAYARTHARKQQGWEASGQSHTLDRLLPVLSSLDRQRWQSVNCSVSPGVAHTAITFSTRHPAVYMRQLAWFVMLAFAPATRGLVH